MSAKLSILRCGLARSVGCGCSAKRVIGRCVRPAGPERGPSIANHQVDIFLTESGTDRYLGRLCKFNACPKDKPQCATPGCGAIPFNKVVNGFVPAPDLLASAEYATLYRRGAGRLRSALDLPQTDGT
jgi:hypothetical protein